MRPVLLDGGHREHAQGLASLNDPGERRPGQVFHTDWGVVHGHARLRQGAHERLDPFVERPGGRQGVGVGWGYL